MSKLRRKRKERLMSMAQLAEAAGVKLISVYRYEVQGRIPDAATAIRLAKALGTTVEDLYDQVEPVAEDPAPDPDDDDEIPF